MTSVIRHTAKGNVRGFREKDVDHFFKIPFAKPPLGKLRFRAPEEPEPWSGELDATTLPPSPIQLPGSHEGEEFPHRDTTPPDEDCLYLNIYAPENAEGKDLPVMVWLYGGHYMGGSSTQEDLNGENLAKNENVIVVSFNYRVGIFGFMANQYLNSLGEDYRNAGLKDMIMTLKWIQTNISEFGGDPGNVTLFGVSAGSSAINVLMTCPQAKGLFHAAISESGSPFDHDEWDITEKQEIAKCDKFMETIGMSQEDLFTAPVERFLENADAYEFSEFCPYVDGDLFPQRLEPAFLKGDVMDIPVMLGCTSDEAFILLGPREKVTKERFDRTVQMKYGGFSDPIYARYGAYLKQSPAYALGRFRSDNTIANSNYYAKCLDNHRTSPTYYYIFQRVMPGRDPYYFGAHHSSEPPYVFQNLKSKYRDFDKTDAKVSQSVSSYWANFARTYNPDGENLEHWEPFTADNNKVMYLDQPCECTELKTKPVTAELQNLLIKRTKNHNPGLDVNFDQG